MNYYSWINKNCADLKHKTVAITGATGGLGTVICDYLAYLGANIICLNRNTDKSNALISDLKSRYPELQASNITLDLEDFSQVKSVSNRLKEFNIDYLILNAGAYKIPRHKCDTGYDNVFQINFISQYYLAYELAPFIKEKGGRVVAVSSIAHNYSKIDVNDIDFSLVKPSSRVYGNAKRYLTFALYRLFDGGKALSIVHPGITLTNITSHYPRIIFALIKHPMKIIFISPKKAALNIIYGMFNYCERGCWIGPRIFNVWGLPKKQRLHTCDEYEAEKICSITNDLIKEISLYAAVKK